MKQLLASAGLMLVTQLSLFFMAAFGAVAQQAVERLPVLEHPTAITSLLQMSTLLRTNPRVIADLHLEFVVCAKSRSEMGIVVAKDDSGMEVLELGELEESINPGDRLRIEQSRCFLRRRSIGVEISSAPLLDNDGVHAMRPATRQVKIKAGRHQLRVDWFNGMRASGLEVLYRAPGDEESKRFAPAWLSSRTESGQTNWVKGLSAEVYEGDWETVPEFDLLQPAKVGVVPNFDLKFATRSDLVGVRFSGFVDLPVSGIYMFDLQSDDGALFFLGNPHVAISKAGKSAVPLAETHTIDAPMADLNERLWAAVEGRVSFVSQIGKGLELELRSDPGALQVSVADADGMDPDTLLNCHVRITGVARGVLTSSGRLVFGRLVAASGKDIAVLESRPAATHEKGSLTAVGQVQSLRIEEAKKGLPVRIRGVVTSVSVPYWISVQDETRGIFVKLNSGRRFVPTSGQSCEIIGSTDVGDFAPIVVANQIISLGDGRLPEPARPTWNELINGSMDVQWVEIQGLVTAVQTNGLRLLLPEGHLNVQLEQLSESDLTQFDKSVVRIRGTFYAVWETETRAVRVGTVLIRNARISVDTPAPKDPFDVPLKRPHELFLFDPNATAFQRVKVRGFVVLAQAHRIFMMDEDAGMRILPVDVFQANVGDVIEAVGYPDISGSAPSLREAVIRKVGTTRIPKARMLSGEEFKQGGLDSTLVRIDGKLMGTHSEQDFTVLEMRAYGRLFLARFRTGAKNEASFQIGSELALTGVYLRQGGRGSSQVEAGGFELLLDSPSNARVLSTPSWWTPRRLLTIVGMLLVVLFLAAGWISSLRRQVELRTQQLQREIREREAAERQRALEAERSRIARDLHDDLGASLTEIGVLASTGQRPATNEDAHTLFHSIASKARGLISALDGIVWAIDPEDNSLQSVADYLAGFADEYLSHSTIACRFKIPVSFPALVLDGRVRHDLLLTVKETLNNIVRHGLASEVEFRMAVVDENLEIEIADNGKGFDPATAKAGSGLKNLSSRLVNHGGACRVESIVGQGTTVSIHLPLSKGKQIAAMRERPDQDIG